MKTSVGCLFFAMLVGQGGVGPPATHQITASIDADGTEHPATDALPRISSIMCNVAYNAPANNTLKRCHITIPGYDGDVEIRAKVGNTGPGTLTLKCVGKAPVKCSALISPYNGKVTEK